MSGYLGEFECKMDDKGRTIVPAGLKRQIPPDALDRMVINRGFDKCLTLYTRNDWDEETKKLNKLSDFKRNDRRFKRLFNSGATEVKIDAASRILIPKKLCAYAEIESDLIFYAYENKIEIWSKKVYDQQMEIDPDDYADLAEEVMGGDDGGDD
ncbi:MAG: division/cell wall cluster transcriptional repressor MraZ [Flavobacteriales bacterium]|nr:division/cell wall cluster transcriptional repressor MraZ [Flavobacteriales bacterium]